MFGKTKFILIDGPDNCGKSSLLKKIEEEYFEAQILKFKKTLPSGTLLRMNTEKDFEILFTCFEHFDASKIYLLDRFIPSNIVYDSVLRGENVSMSMFYLNEFRRRFDVLEIYLTRPHIQKDFIDDRIKASKTQFNRIIDEYKNLGQNYQLLTRNEFDEVNGEDKEVAEKLDEMIHSFFTR